MIQQFTLVQSLSYVYIYSVSLIFLSMLYTYWHMNMHTMCFSSRKLQTLGTGPLFGPPSFFFCFWGECLKKSNSTSHFDIFSGLATSLWLLWSSGTPSVGGFGQRWSYARLKEFGAKKLGKEVPRKEWRKGGGTWNQGGWWDVKGEIGRWWLLVSPMSFNLLPMSIEAR